MLVRNGVCLIDPDADVEGFSAGAASVRFGHHRRSLSAGGARSLSPTEMIAAVCDGRTDEEAGLDLTELAQAMIGLGAADAINLDGGGSASLVVGGELVNVPHEDHGLPIPGGRSISTALRFLPR